MVEGKNLNEHLLESGLTFIPISATQSLDYKTHYEVRRFIQKQTMAQKQNNGLWSLGDEKNDYLKENAFNIGWSDNMPSHWQSLKTRIVSRLR